jgi:hypothetical protein
LDQHGGGRPFPTRCRHSPQHGSSVSFRSTAAIQRFVTAGKSSADTHRVRNRESRFRKVRLRSLGSFVAIQAYCPNAAVSRPYPAWRPSQRGGAEEREWDARCMIAHGWQGGMDPSGLRVVGRLPMARVDPCIEQRDAV